MGDREGGAAEEVSTWLGEGAWAVGEVARVRAALSLEQAGSWRGGMGGGLGRGRRNDGEREVAQARWRRTVAAWRGAAARGGGGFASPMATRGQAQGGWRRLGLGRDREGKAGREKGKVDFGFGFEFDEFCQI